jgi:hypothetical protein
MAEWLGNVQWQISVRKLEDLSVLSGAASGASAILLTVTGFRIYRTSRSIGRSAAEDELLIIPSARQLALTRYCLVQAFAAYDPGLLVVSSGQTNWDDGWWPSVGTSVQMPPTADRIASDIAEPLASEASNSEPHTALCCLDCGASLRLDARYCSECGSEVTVTTSLDGQPTRSDANLKEY